MISNIYTKEQFPLNNYSKEYELLYDTCKHNLRIKDNYINIFIVLFILITLLFLICYVKTFIRYIKILKKNKIQEKNTDKEFLNIFKIDNKNKQLRNY